MKDFLRNTFRLNNRNMRIFVGLILVGLLSYHFAIAQEEVETKDIKFISPDELQAAGVSSEIEYLEKLAKTDHVKLLTLSKNAFAKQNRSSYTCTFKKQERINGKLSKMQTIDVKFRRKPFSVAMAWKKNPVGDGGDRIVYVEGLYQDKNGKSQMVVRPTWGWVRPLVGGSVKKLPDCEEVLKKTLRPCTEFGFANGIQSLIDVYEIARQREECVEKFAGFAEEQGRQCIVLERFLPERKEYPAKRTIICIDLETLLPIRIKGYDWNDKVNCDYIYTNIDLNKVLTDKDFTPQANGITYKN